MSKCRIHPLFLCAALLVVASASAQNGNDKSVVGQPWIGAPAIRETNSQITARARLDDATPKLRHMILRHHKKGGHFTDTVEFPIYSTPTPPATGTPAIVTTNQPGPFGSNSTAIAFTGPTLSDTGSYPPDTMGAVGPAQFIVAVNGRLRSYSKTTGLADGAINSGMDSFFSSVMTPGNNFTSDPRIRYDRLTGRWFVLIIDVPGSAGTLPNRVLLAVSDSSVINGGTVWSFFQFQQDLVSPAGDTGRFADYPTLGLDANALYIGANMFTSSGSFANTTAFVVRKSSLLTGGPIVVTAFRGLITRVQGAYTGPFTPQGVDNFDPAATEGYFIGTDYSSTTRLRLRRVSSPGGTPSLSGNVGVTTSAFAIPITVPHLGNTGGSAGELDGLDERLLAAHYRNGFLWTAHNVGVNNSGGTSSVTRDGVRWYQISGIPTGQTPTVQQSGTLYDSSTTNWFYWMGSVMVSGQGHVVLGCSAAGANEYANAAVTGRLASDTTGTMRTPSLFTASTSAYNAPYNRWGDYSYTSLDPTDDMTLWTIQEFCNANNSYAVQIAKILAPPPALPTNCSPATLLQGATVVNLVLTGPATNGAGFFDPGAAFSNRLAAVISGGGVTLNSITCNNPTNLTLNVTVATNATPGARNIIVTNPDGQSVTNASGLFTVIASNHPPVLTALSNRTIVELTTLAFTNSATDPDIPTNTLTFSLDTGAPSNATLNATSGVFSWTPTEAQGPNTNAISVIVTDNGSPSLSATQSFTIIVLETNSAPTLTTISDRTITELTTLTFTNSASDFDLPTNTLAFSLATGAPSNATLNASSGLFSWTPTEAQGPSTNVISVIVSDNGSPNLSATQSFTVIVVETNSPPVLNTNADQTIYEGETLTLTNAASDSDLPTNTLAFSFGSGAPSNATLNAASGVFSWTPTLSQGPGTNPISIIVADNGSPSMSATQSFTVVVLDTNPPPATFTISGTVELQAFAGTNRLVRFIASEVTGVATNLLQTTNMNLTFSNGAAAYTLPVPTNTTHISAKTAWNLRRKLASPFSGGLATVDFTGAASLKGGDIVTVNGGTIDDTDNAVTSSDYLLLLGNYLQTVGGDPAIGRADIDGDGAITSADYLLLLGNYLQAGDSP